MKKHVLLGSVLLAAISTFSQNGRIKPKATAIVNTKIIAEAKFGGVGNETAVPTTNNTTDVVAAGQSDSKTSVVNTWNNFTASMNIYGSSIGYCKPLQYNDELNAISFAHRKSPTYSTNGSTSQTESGSIVAMISTDCGQNWDSTLVYADPTNRGRYPQGAIYNPPATPSNTNIGNAYIVTNGPVTLGTGWVGNFYASKQLGSANYDDNISTVPNAVQYFSNTGPYPPNLGKHDFAAYSFSATDDGKMRTLGTVAGDINNTTTGQDSAVMVVTGTFNNGVFDWAGTVIDPPTVKGSDGERQWVSRPMMAWNESGNIGYVVVIGARKGATGANVGFQPIVYKTTNSGATWSLETGINFNSPAFADVRRPIISVTTDSTLEVPFFNWIEGMDVTVDKDNKLHIFSTVIGTFSNHPDSLGFISSFGAEGYRWPHTPGFRPYLYDFIYDGTNASPSWSHITVDSMSTEGPGATTTANGYQDNPWDVDPTQSNQKVRIDARLQMSRTPDGKYLVYTWAESDTTFTNSQKKWNNLPNIKARVMDVTASTIHTMEINVTGTANSNVANRAMFHFVSPKCRLASLNTTNGPVLRVPMTVSNSNPYRQLTANSHWFSNVTLNYGNVPDGSIVLCGSLTNTNTGVGISENASLAANSAVIYPNPAKTNAVLSINLSNNSKVQIDVLNTMGQVVKTSKTEGVTGSNSVNIDLSGLASGIYMVNVKVDNVSSTKKLVIE